MSLHHLTHSPKKKIENYLGITINSKESKITHNIISKKYQSLINIKI